MTNILPNDLDIEKIVLGYILVNLTIDFNISEDDFYHEPNRYLIKLMKDLYSNGIDPDVATIVSKLKAENELEKCGGLVYILSLTDSMPRMPDGLPVQYLRILKEKSALRKTIQASQEAAVKAYANEPFSEIYSSLTNQLDVLQSIANPAAGPTDIGKALIDAYKEAEQIADFQKKGISHGLSLGFKDLDKLIPSGIKGDEMFVIGGRPGQGKTSFLLNLLSHMSNQGKTTLMFSIEMSISQILFRLLSMEAEVDLGRIRSGFMSKDDWIKFNDAAGRMSHWKCWIYDSTEVRVDDVRRIIRGLRQQIDAVFIDYLQIMTIPKNMVRANDQEKIAFLSTNLKFMNKDLHIPFFVNAQLNRDFTKRKGTKPQLSDLRSSGKIEQDTDMALLLHRKESTESFIGAQSTASLILAKQRNGPQGEVEVAWNGKYSKFNDLYQYQQPEQTPEDEAPW